MLNIFSWFSEKPLDFREIESVYLWPQEDHKNNMAKTRIKSESSTRNRLSLIKKIRVGDALWRAVESYANDHELSASAVARLALAKLVGKNYGSR